MGECIYDICKNWRKYIYGIFKNQKMYVCTYIYLIYGMYLHIYMLCMYIYMFMYIFVCM